MTAPTQLATHAAAENVNKCLSTLRRYLDITVDL